MTTKSETRVITPIGRLSFPAIFKPAKAMQEGGDQKYQCELIFAKNEDLSALRKVATQAAYDKWGDKAKSMKLRTPFRDGDSDREGKDGYAGCTFISARSKDKPGVVVGPNREPCLDESQVYGGCFVKLSVTAFAYDTNGNKGVAFALNNVWKIRDGEPFGSRRAADQEFADEEVDAEAFGDGVDSLL